MRKILLSWFVAVLAAVGWGRVPAQPEVLEVARHLVAKASFQNLLPGRTVESVAWVALEDDHGVWAAALAPGGHLILSSSTKYRALISWGNEAFTTPDRASPQYALLLRAAKRAAAAEAGNGEEHPSWTVDSGRSASLLAAVELPESAIISQPVVTTHWNQRDVMDWYVPGDAPCGCVATAMAQMMRALEWPVYAEGFFDATLSYTAFDDSVSTERYAFAPYTKFDYSLMADKPSTYDSPVANQQLARLVLLNDILAQMNFDSNGSGAIGTWVATTPWSMETNRRGLNSGKAVYNDADLAYIRQAMADGIPVPATIPGHEIVASGYALYEDAPYVQLNYGWGGGLNGWYHVDETDEYLITYPLRTAQCDPLPAVSPAGVKLSWHQPKCYDNKVSGFTVTATELPAGTASRMNWRDDFTTLSGTRAGNRSAIRLANYTLQVSLNGASNDSPKALYTWAPIFVPTASTVWSFSYSYAYARGPIHLQVLPLEPGGVWKTVEVLDPGLNTASGWKNCSIDLAAYAGVPCKLRLYAYPSFYTNSYAYATSFSMADMNLFSLERVITEPSETVELTGAELREYTFPAGTLTPGKRYAFTVTPVFADGGEAGVASMPCSTQIADETFSAETFAPMTFSSPSAEAREISSMNFDRNVTRYCTYSGYSVIRLETAPSVTRVELHTSHPDAYPSAAFAVEPLGGGLYDILINSTVLPTAPQVNDRLNLTVSALTAKGTRTSHELSLIFTHDEAFALSETMPNADGYPAELYAVVTEGDHTLSSLTWTDLEGTVYDDADIRWPYVTTVYLSVSGGSLTLDGSRNLSGMLAVEPGAVVKLTRADALGNLTVYGTGTVRCENVFPAKRGGLTANLWRGTVELAGDIRLADRYVSLEALGNANSRLLVSGNITGYLAKDKTCEIPLELNGSITIDDGYTGGWYIFSKLTGSGSFTHNKNLPYTIAFTDAAGFRGALEVAQVKACLVIGSTGDAAEGAIAVSAGKTAHIASGKRWSTSSDFSVKGTLGGSGTIESDVTFASGSVLDATQGVLTVTGAVTATELPVTVDETTYGLILASEKLGASTFTPSDETALLLTDAAGLIRTTRLVQVTKADGTETVSDAAAEAIARKAADAGIYRFTLDPASAAPDGAVVFENVLAVAPEQTRGAVASGVVTLDYAFGIRAMTVRPLTEADGVPAAGMYLVLSAEVTNDAGTAAYAEGTAVTVAVNGEACAEATPLPSSAAGAVSLAIPFDRLALPAGADSCAFRLTVSAARE